MLPRHAVLLASSPTCPVQAFRIGSHVYATQFHPELDAARTCAPGSTSTSTRATSSPSRPVSSRRRPAAATSPTRLPSCAGSPSVTRAARTGPEPGRGRLPPFPGRPAAVSPASALTGRRPAGVSAGLGGQPQAEADERDAGDPFEPSLHGGPAQPAAAPRAAIQARAASQAPVSAMNHSPSARGNSGAGAPAGMKPGRNAMKKTPILGLSRLDSSPLRYARRHPALPGRGQAEPAGSAAAARAACLEPRKGQRLLTPARAGSMLRPAGRRCSPDR